MTRSLWAACLAAFSLTASLASAGSREFLVTDRATNRILRYEFDGSFLGELVGPGNSLSGNELDEPVAMQLAPTGELLVANRGNGRVVKYDRFTGEFLGDFANGLDQPTDLLIHKNQVFVSSLGPTGFDGNIIYRFNADGSSAGNIGTGTSPSGRTGLSVGADGLLYVGSFFDGRVLRYDPTTGAPAGNDADGTFASLSPAGSGTGYITFDDNNDLLAIGLFSFNVVKIDGTTGANQGQFIPATAGLFFPSDILALREENKLLITSIGNDDPNLGLPLGFGYISQFNLTTGSLENFAFIAGSGGLQQPTSLLVVSNLAGDLNGDGFVGQDDLNLILSSWGQNVPSGTTADISRDGFVGQDDLNVILSNWGNGLPLETALRTAGFTAVPESSTFLLCSLALGIGAIVARRQRTR